jgi:hypothetical protein
MTRGDATLELSADRLQELSDHAAEAGGPAAKMAEPLAQDARFLRRMKPSSVGARVRSAAGRRRGPSPFLVIGAALAAGIVLAKVLDWRGHAHPRG